VYQRFAAESTSKEVPSVVKIVKTNERFELRVNGKPFFINGAGGVPNLDALIKAGGNSVRTWRNSKADLDKAHEKGLMVCMGLSLVLPRHFGGTNFRRIPPYYSSRKRAIPDVL